MFRQRHAAAIERCVLARVSAPERTAHERYMSDERCGVHIAVAKAHVVMLHSLSATALPRRGELRAKNVEYSRLRAA